MNTNVVYDLIIKNWKQKTKLIDDMELFKLLFVFSLIAIAFLVLVIEVLLVLDKNLFAFFILFTLIIQYNKPSIVMNISTLRKASTRVCGAGTWFRFIFFQVLKENITAPITVLVTILLAPWALLYRPLFFVGVLGILFAELGLYYRSIYQAIGDNYSSNYRNRTNNLRKISGIAQSNIRYFTTLPIKEYFELLFELVLMLVLAQCISVVAVNYILIVLFVVDIEILEDRSMVTYNVHYGKFAFSHVAGVKHFQKYRMSDEYRVFLKYLIMEAALIVYGGPVLLGFLVLLYAISYRYYCGMQKILMGRTLFRNTVFRLCMFYFTLIAISPFLFEDELCRIPGYSPVLGFVFFIVVSVTMVFAPLEKVIKIAGESIDEKQSTPK